ncbi:MAG: hypothetical protein DMG05_29260 [Acidobacteria bacterium]|nr:MAG: hypothetical protein DMG05_29260 [Acidobacteriota bacterium]
MLGNPRFLNRTHNPHYKGCARAGAAARRGPLCRRAVLPGDGVKEDAVAFGAEIGRSRCGSSLGRIRSGSRVRFPPAWWRKQQFYDFNLRISIEKFVAWGEG